MGSNFYRNHFAGLLFSCRFCARSRSTCRSVHLFCRRFNHLLVRPAVSSGSCVKQYLWSWRNSEYHSRCCHSFTRYIDRHISEKSEIYSEPESSYSSCGSGCTYRHRITLERNFPNQQKNVDKLVRLFCRWAQFIFTYHFLLDHRYPEIRKVGIFLQSNRVKFNYNLCGAKNIKFSLQHRLSVQWIYPSVWRNLQWSALFILLHCCNLDFPVLFIPEKHFPESLGNFQQETKDFSFPKIHFYTLKIRITLFLLKQLQ